MCFATCARIRNSWRPSSSSGLLNGIYVAAFVHRLTPERIINFTVDKLEESPIKPPPEALAKMRTDGVEQQKAVEQQIGNVLKSLVGHFFGVAFLAALCLLGVLAFGGRMHYWQTYAVVAYVTLPFTIIQKGISFLILYLKSPDDIHPLLGQETLVYDNLGLLVSAKDHPVIFVIATSIGVLSFYRSVVECDWLARGRLQGQFIGGVGRGHHAVCAVPAVWNGVRRDLPGIPVVAGARATGALAA